MRLEIPVGERSIVLETGKLARQAGGAVTARLGDTTILSTATRSKAPRPGATFLPLSVDIEERMSSAGKIPGGFIKREGRPSERAILTSRLTDRPLRPLFPKATTTRYRS
jgi:polyribonucleotide nucleotidyltransferase